MSDFKFYHPSGRIYRPKLWLIDLDDTLYSASAGMFHDIHVLMDDYIQSALGVSSQTANLLRKEYWQRYGVTFLGLWLHHGIDPVDFLTKTHNVDISSVKTRGLMRQSLVSLPGKKVLFTNAPNHFAERILKKNQFARCLSSKVLCQRHESIRTVVPQAISGNVAESFNKSRHPTYRGMLD